MNYVRSFVAFTLMTALALAPAQAGMGSLNNNNIDKIPPRALAVGTGAQVADIGPMFLVRIEFPGAITPAGLDALRRHVRSTDPFQQGASDEEINTRLMDQINKSSYYALRLYRNLLAHGGLPKQGVALQPVVLDTPNAPGQILTTLRPKGMVPSIVTIKSAITRTPTMDVTSPQPRPDAPGGVKVMENSFADFVTSQISIVSEPAAWPGGGGVIAAFGSETNLGVLARSCDPPACTVGGTEIGDGLQIIYGAVLPGAVPLSKVGNQLPYPWPVRYENTRVTTCPDAPSAEGAICLHERLVIALTKQALVQVDPYLATRFQWRNYIERLDPELAAFWPGASWGDEERKRLGWIKELMRAERSFIALTSAKSAELAITGPLGIKLREQRASERSYGSAIAKANKPDMSLATILGMAIAITNYASAFASKDTLGQFGAMSQMQAIEQRNLALTNQTLQQLQSVFAAQTQRSYADLYGARFEETVLGQRVQADSLETLQSEFASLYKKLKQTPLQKQSADCLSFGTGGGFEWVANGRCQLGPPKSYDAVGVTGRDRNSGAFIGFIEKKDKFEIISVNRVMPGGQTKSMNTGQTFAAHQSGSLNYAYFNGYFLTGPSSISYQEGNPATKVVVRENGKERSATPLEADTLNAAIAKWRNDTRSLISYDHSR